MNGSTNTSTRNFSLSFQWLCAKFQIGNSCLLICRYDGGNNMNVVHTRWLKLGALLVIL